MSSTNNAKTFRRRIAGELENFVLRQQSLLPADEVLRIDLHCHDRNSDVPDETLGRLLGLPETWLETDQLLSTLRANGADAFTVTNHNDARSCFELQDRGVDVLVGAEFSCTVPDENVGIHVLTYGFTPEQESRLDRLRKDVYRFQEYVRREGLVTVLAHPLYFYSGNGRPSPRLMDKLGLLFQRFEAVNGQRDTWQNLLTATWIEGLDAEAIDAMSRRVGIGADDYCERPYEKWTTGGSDCHMGIFAGMTGTLLHVPDLRARLAAGAPRSALVLEALRTGRTAPYGSCSEEEKLAVAFLDYFCQVALHMRDPGLLRLLLHKGDPGEKLLALGVGNAMLEIQRHKTTLRFLRLFHRALHGQAPGLATRLFTSRAFRPILREVEGIAAARRQSPTHALAAVRTSVPRIFRVLNGILAERVGGKIGAASKAGVFDRLDTRAILDRMELPIQLRRLFGGRDDNPSGHETARNAGRQSSPDLASLADGLPFPFLASAVMGGASFAAARVLYENREFLDGFARSLGKFEHPRRALWLTDTFSDQNGVSHALRSTLEEIRRRDLPIDILVCDGSVKSGDHIVALDPVHEFELPFYRGQKIRMPDLMELQRVFSEGGYDRIVCSTEAPMGLLALYLKHAFSVPAHFFLHTDWMDFSKRTLKLDRRGQDRLRRVLRAFYRGFDGLFVLNSEQREWLASPDMGVPRERIFATAHWPEAVFLPRPDRREELFPGVARTDLVLAYVGRLSEEKGVMDLPRIYRRIRERVPEARMVVAGTGPAEERMRQEMPDALFLGWVGRDRLPDVYGSADLLLFPSRFDTFGCSVVEAMSCGLPVVAYDTKGPRDLIESGISGFLAESEDEFVQLALAVLRDPEYLAKMRHMAALRAGEYAPEPILSRMLRDLGLAGEAGGAVQARRTVPPGEKEPGILARLAELLDEG